MEKELLRKALLKLAQSPEDLNLETTDLADQILFRFKNYFSSKLAINKLFSNKLKQLESLIGPFEVIHGKQNAALTNLDWEDSQEIHQAFLSHAQSLSQVKQQLMQSATPRSLCHYAKQLLQLQVNYSRLWHIEVEDDSEVVVSKEPDPMVILEAIKFYKQQGGRTFEQLNQRENNPPQVLIYEQKRLSLLLNKYG